jgi:exodeoxyribonuclease VII large subunit
VLTRFDNILSVSELTRAIKSVLEEGFENIVVQGEISNFKRHTSGHFYFTLKDANAQLSAVMWRGRNSALSFTPQDGMKVIAQGNITLYEARGNYQLDCYELQPAGRGELQLAYEQLKQQLANEGLFDSERKKNIPLFPERIGIVTSPTGAALQDMLNVLARRFPCIEIILYPVRVQGSGAAEEIAQAIRDFNALQNIDVMVIGRGGGSLEDLWAFNEEIVARAIVDSAIPVVSAVGHEIDFSISDFVADLRAPTPSAAAELIVPNSNDLREEVKKNISSMRNAMNDMIRTNKERIQSLVQSYSFRRPFDAIRQYFQRIDEMQATLQRVYEYRIKMQKQYVETLLLRLQSLNPNAVLQRGYAIVYENGKAITSAKRLKKNDEVALQFYDGRLPAKIIE